MIKKISKFFTEAKIELKKVTWPSKDEVKGSTIVVLTITGLLGIYIGAVDFVLSNVIKFLIH